MQFHDFVIVTCGMPTFMLGNLVPKYFHTFLDEASSQEWSLKLTSEQIKSNVIILEPSYNPANLPSEY